MKFVSSIYEIDKLVIDTNTTQLKRESLKFHCHLIVYILASITDNSAYFTLTFYYAYYSKKNGSTRFQSLR